MIIMDYRLRNEIHANHSGYLDEMTIENMIWQRHLPDNAVRCHHVRTAV